MKKLKLIILIFFVLSSLHSLSQDYDKNWEFFGKPFDMSLLDEYGSLSFAFKEDSKIFVGANNFYKKINGIYKREVTDTNWTRCKDVNYKYQSKDTNGKYLSNIFWLHTYGTSGIIGAKREFDSINNKIYVSLINSTNNGLNWTKKVLTISCYAGVSSQTQRPYFDILDDSTIVCQYKNSIFLSSDFGDTWEKRDFENNPDRASDVSPLTTYGKDEIMIMRGTIGSDPRDLCYSKDKGLNWDIIWTGKERMEAIKTTDGIYLFGYGSSQNIYKLDQSKTKWDTLKFPIDINLKSVYFYNNIFYALGFESLLLSKDSCKTWEIKYLPRILYRICHVTDSYIVIHNSNEILISFDKGNTWKDLTNNKTLEIGSVFMRSLDYLFYGTEDGQVFFSSDTGNTWKSRINGLNLQCKIEYTENVWGGIQYVNNLGLFAQCGYGSQGVYFSSDDGDSWNYRSKGLFDELVPLLSALKEKSNYLFTCYNNNPSVVGPCFYSTNYGKYWESLSIPKILWNTVSYDINDNLNVFRISGVDFGKHQLTRSMDIGKTWDTLIVTGSDQVICGNESDVYICGGQDSLFYYSSDNGNN